MTLLDRSKYQPSPAMKAALRAIAWKTPATMIKARKDAARAILRGEPNRYCLDRPLRIAQRYARFKTHVERQRTKLEAERP